MNSTFRYVPHGKRNQLRKNPEEVINKSGVCRDYVCLYTSLMKVLKIDYEVIQLPGHMYLRAYPAGYNCKLDMDYLGCNSNGI